MITLTQKQIQQKPTIQYNTQQVAFQSTAQYVIKNMPKVPTFQKYLDILTFALQNVSVEGLYLEFGVYTGRTINHISSLVPNHTVYGFDSFEGLPCTWRTGFEKGAFKTNKLPDVNSNVVLIKGLFEETLQDFCQKHSENCSFIHIDSDLYRSAKCIFDVLKDKICSGTIIVFDEYFNYPGWEEGEHRAFMEFVSESKFEFEYIGYVDIHEQVAVRIL